MGKDTHKGRVGSSNDRALIFVLRNEARSSAGVALTLTMLGAGITEWVPIRRYLLFAAVIAVSNVASALMASRALRFLKSGVSDVQWLLKCEMLLSGLGGCIWGLAPLLLGLTIDPAPSAVIVIFQGSLLSITTISLGTDRFRYLVFSLPLVVCTVISNMVIGGRLQHIVAAGIVLFGLFLQGLQREIGRTFSENLDLSSQLEKLAKTDALTGIVNRHGWNEAIVEAIASEDRASRFGIVVADVDRFKGMNDTFGHEVGDQVLVSIAQRLASVVKSGDTVARLGGDEFGVLLRNIESEADLSSIVERIRNNLEHDVIHSGVATAVSISLGAALSDGTLRPAEVLASADRAMYADKRLRKLTLSNGAAGASDSAFPLRSSLLSR